MSPHMVRMPDHSPTISAVNPEPEVFSAAEQRLLDSLEWQQRWCLQPSPFTSQLLGLTRQWLTQDRAALQVFAASHADPMSAAVALRWAGGLHHLALRGLSPWSRLWPPQRVPPRDDALADALRQAWSEHRDHLLRALQRAPQTNEVGRSAVLLPGFLELAARRPGWPLALLEIGSSAGLNLWPERWHYDYGPWTWGPPDAPLSLQAGWTGPVPHHVPGELLIAERQACDLSPMALDDPDEALRLMSFVWPDQAERLQRLRAAVAAVRQASAESAAHAERQSAGDAQAPAAPVGGTRIHASSAAAFLQRSLAEPRPACWTVVFHSIVWQYIDPAEQQQVHALLQAAGARASEQAPLAWLRMEPPQPDQPVELRCTLWPGGETQRWAQVHPHGQTLHWLDPDR